MVNQKLFGWVIGAKQRVSVIKAMDKKRSISRIQEKSRQFSPNIALNNVAHILRDCTEQGLAVCSNEGSEKLYGLTMQGDEIRRELAKA